MNTGNALAVPYEPLPPWMVELALALKLWEPGELPTGLIVGSAVIESYTGPFLLPPDHSRSTTHIYHWHLTNVQRVARMRKPSGHPQPMWFEPF